MNRSTLVLSMVTIAFLVLTGCATTNTARYGENCIVQRTSSFGTLRIGSQRDVYCTTFTGQGGGWNTGYPMMGGGIPVNIPPTNGQFGSQPVMMTGGWGGTVGSEYMWSAPTAYYRRGYTDGREIEEAERRAEQVRPEPEVRRPAPVTTRQSAPAPTAPPPDPPPTRSVPVETEAELEAKAQRALEWLRTYRGGE